MQTFRFSQGDWLWGGSLRGQFTGMIPLDKKVVEGLLGDWCRGRACSVV